MLSSRSFCAQKINTTTAGFTFGQIRCNNRYSWSVPKPDTPAE